MLTMNLRKFTFFTSGIKEEFDGDSEEVDGAHGQGWRDTLQGWTTRQNHWNMLTVQLPICHQLWMVSKRYFVVWTIYLCLLL